MPISDQNKSASDDSTVVQIEASDGTAIDPRAPSFCNTGQAAALSVSTSAVLAKGGAAALVGRKILTVTPTDGVVYWGFNNTVTASSGSPILKNQTAAFPFSEAATIYLIAASGTVNCRVTEAGYV